MVADPNSLNAPSLPVGKPTPRKTESAGDASSVKGQQGTRRFVFTHWSDMDDRELCQHALTAPPERTPISGRTGLAVPKWLVVARRDQRVLICNRVHTGDCDWPWDVQAG